MDRQCPQTSLDGNHTGLPIHILSQTPGLAVPFLAGWTQPRTEPST